jgi:hypothetical protein
MAAGLLAGVPTVGPGNATTEKGLRTGNGRKGSASSDPDEIEMRNADGWITVSLNLLLWDELSLVPARKPSTAQTWPA